MNGAERTLLVDASVLITLAEIDQFALLATLGGNVAVPATVDAEVVAEPAASRLDWAIEKGWIRRLDVLQREELERAASHLGHPLDGELSGDTALLTRALVVPNPVVVTDDKPLRKTCKALSIPVSGSIGVLVRTVELGALDEREAKDALYAMDEVSARLSVSLVRRAERLIEEAVEE